MHIATVKNDFITALTTETSNVYFEHHINDNTFIKFEVQRPHSRVFSRELGRSL